MKYKWKAKKDCTVCAGKGYFYTAMDFYQRCDCYKQTKAYKNRPRKYKIVMLDPVKKFLSKLSPEDQDRALDAINALAKNPKIGKKVKGTKLRYFDF